MSSSPLNDTQAMGKVITPNFAEEKKIRERLKEGDLTIKSFETTSEEVIDAAANEVHLTLERIRDGLSVNESEVQQMRKETPEGFIEYLQSSEVSNKSDKIKVIFKAKTVISNYPESKEAIFKALRAKWLWEYIQSIEIALKPKEEKKPEEPDTSVEVAQKEEDRPEFKFFAKAMILTEKNQMEALIFMEEKLESVLSKEALNEDDALFIIAGINLINWPLFLDVKIGSQAIESSSNVVIFQNPLIINQKKSDILNLLNDNIDKLKSYINSFLEETTKKGFSRTASKSDRTTLAILSLCESYISTERNEKLTWINWFNDFMAWLKEIYNLLDREVRSWPIKKYISCRGEELEEG